MSPRGLLALVRPANLLALWAASEAGVRLAAGTSFQLLTIAPALAAAFGYARNDAVDAAADRWNKPARPIPSGSVGPRMAHRLAWVFLVAGGVLALAAAPRPIHWIFYEAGALVLYLYSPWLKGRGPVGPATVSVLAGLAVLWGGYMGLNPARSYAAAALAAAVTFARECAKDLEDEAGDRAAGKRTWPVDAGGSTPRLALRMASALGLALVPLPWALGDAGILYLALAGGLTAPVLLWCVLRPPPDGVSAGRASRLLKGALLGGIAALWLGAGRG